MGHGWNEEMGGVEKKIGCDPAGVWHVQDKEQNTSETS